MLDMYVAVFGALAVYFGLRYVQSGFRVWWLAACGAAVGAAVASKWSGALAAAAVLVVVLPPLVRQGRGRVKLPPVAAAAVLAPLAVYLLASAPYFAAGHGVLDWLRLQEHMATFGWAVTGDRSFASRPVTWPFDAYPIWYKWSVGPDGTSGLLAIGNFALWWAGILSWVVLGLLAALRRDWRLGIAPALVAVLYLPWLLTTRQTYIYYMVPVVPFVAVLVATGLSRLAGSGWAPPPGVPLAAPCAGGEARRRSPGRGLGLLSGLRGDRGAVRAVRHRRPVPFEYYTFLTPFTTWK